VYAFLAPEASISITGGNTVPFNSTTFIFTGAVTVLAGFDNQPPGSRITLVNPGVSAAVGGGTGAGIRVADTGFYQVTWGVSTGTANSKWVIELNAGGVTNPLILPIATTNQLSTMSTIIQITVNPTIIYLVPNATATISSSGGGGGILNAPFAPLCFVTVVKLF
jgi:hypothetical protein